MSIDDFQPETELERVLEKALVALIKASRMDSGSRSLNAAIKELTDEYHAVNESSHPDEVERRRARRMAVGASAVLDHESQKPAPDGALQSPLDELLARQEKKP